MHVCKTVSISENGGMGVCDASMLCAMYPLCMCGCFLNWFVMHALILMHSCGSTHGVLEKDTRLCESENGMCFAWNRSLSKNNDFALSACGLLCVLSVFRRCG